MSVLSSRQFAGIHTQLNMPPRFISALSCSGPQHKQVGDGDVFFPPTLSSLSNYSNNKWEKYTCFSLTSRMTNTSSSCQQLPAQQLHKELDPANWRRHITR